MTLPKGAIYQLLRQQAVDAIPLGTHLNFRQPVTLADWQRTGTYVVASTTATSFTLVASSVDVGGALLSDAQLHLAHAAEHKAATWNDLRSGQWNSPAWLTVTFYYWAYFAAMALTRMLGDTVWFVNDATAAQLRTLSPTGSKTGAGTYEFRCESQVSVTDRQVRLRKRSGRIHEQLWQTVFGLLDKIQRSVPQGSADPIEDRLYLAVLNSARRLGNDWPSQLRNLVNYRPGFAYDSVRQGSNLDSFGFVPVDEPSDLADLIDRMETNVISAVSSRPLELEARLAAHVLVDLTFLIDLIANTLHDDLVERHGLDRRWTLKRNSFAARNGLVLGDGKWPC